MIPVTTESQQKNNLNYVLLCSDKALNCTYKRGDNKSSILFPHQQLSKLLLELHSCYYLERTFYLRTVLELTFSRYENEQSYKMENIYKEASIILDKNPNTIKSNVRICIQDIFNNAPETLLHSIFYIEKSLSSILNEFSFLNCNSTKDLINYLSELTKRDELTIDKKYKLMYNLVFFVDDKCINFCLKRKNRYK